MTKVVFYGASSVEGAGASSPDKRFSTLICRTLGWEEVNLGIGGTTVTGRNEEGFVVEENSGIARVPDVLEAEPDLVIILYGANDFAQSCPLGDPRQFRQGTFFWDYDTLLRGLLDGLEAEQVVASTSQYRADAERPNALGLRLTDYNKVITELGERYNLRVLDAYHDAGIDPDNFAPMAADEAHLNDAGHECLAAFFIENLQQR